MFEELFKNMQLSAIGAKVVDDTKDFTVPVYVPPPPEEGKAVITNVDAPSEFTPGEAFHITVGVRNDGGDDDLFIRVKDRDTGAVLKEFSQYVPSGTPWSYMPALTLTKETDFHGRVEAGHLE